MLESSRRQLFLDRPHHVVPEMGILAEPRVVRGQRVWRRPAVGVDWPKSRPRSTCELTVIVAQLMAATAITANPAASKTRIGLPHTSLEVIAAKTMPTRVRCIP